MRNASSKAGLFQERGGAGDDAQLTAQIVRGLAPDHRPPLARFDEAAHGAFQVVASLDGLLLLEPGKLLGAVGHSNMDQGRERTLGREKRLVGKLGQRVAGQFQFIEQAVVQMPPFQDDLPQVVALLPAVFTVLDRGIRLGSFRRGPFGGNSFPQAVFELGEYVRDVIAELGAGKIVGAGELLVGGDGGAPGFEDRFTPGGEIVSQGRFHGGKRG